MVDIPFTESLWFSYLVLPLLIFLARVLDVSMGTVRLIFIARGMRIIAPLVGFFEILIWVIAIGQLMQNLTAWYNYVAYAGGFAAGTWIGMWIESKLAIGVVSVRIITRTDASELVGSLRIHGFGVTSLIAEGSTGPVNVIYTLVSRQQLNDVLARVREFNPLAFYAVEDIRFAKTGNFSIQPYRTPGLDLALARARKGK